MGFFDDFPQRFEKAVNDTKERYERKYAEFQSKSNEELKDIVRNDSAYADMARKILSNRGVL